MTSERPYIYADMNAWISPNRVPIRARVVEPQLAAQGLQLREGLEVCIYEFADTAELMVFDAIVLKDPSTGGWLAEYDDATYRAQPYVFDPKRPWIS